MQLWHSYQSQNIDLIDFDEGYIYDFTEGNGGDDVNKCKIKEGNLNSYVLYQYENGSPFWSLHFKYKENPDHLIVQDHNGFDYDYYPTDLDDALKIFKTKRAIMNQ